MIELFDFLKYNRSERFKKRAARNKKYAASHRDQINAGKRRRYALDPEKYARKNRAYYLANRDEIIEKHKLKRRKKAARKQKCGARNWSDEFWNTHQCGLEKGHEGPHQCYAVYQNKRNRKTKVRVPCGFSWPVPEEVFELYRENS